MESSTEDTCSRVLEALMTINGDRSHGYERASTETDDPLLESLFLEMASRSHRFRHELSLLLQQRGTASTGATSALENTFQVWMEARRDRDRALASCETGEHAALKLYEDSLHTPAVALEGAIRPVIEKQLRAFQIDFERIRVLKEYVNP